MSAMMQITEHPSTSGSDGAPHEWPLSDFAKNGVAVIPSVFPRDECARIGTAMWDYIEATNPAVKRNDPSTQNSKTWPLNLHGIFKHTTGHLQFVWDVRQHPKVVDTFVSIWRQFGGLDATYSAPTERRGIYESVKSEDMLSSFDAFSFMHQNQGAREGGKTWLHTDQTPIHSELNPQFKLSIQGFITMQDIEHDDATFVCLPGSHLYHQGFFEKYVPKDEWVNSAKSNWHLLTEDEIKGLESDGFKPVRVSAPAGSMVIWDSRTFHSTSYALKNRRVPKARQVVYTCMAPRAHYSQSKSFTLDLENKRKAFSDMRTTSHTPLPCRLDSKNPRIYSKDNIIVKRATEYPLLTTLGARLAGFGSCSEVPRGSTNIVSATNSKPVKFSKLTKADANYLNSLIPGGRVEYFVGMNEDEEREEEERKARLRDEAENEVKARYKLAYKAKSDNFAVSCAKKERAKVGPLAGRDRDDEGDE